jgi:transcriptional regulator with XRE-family HTH domain
MLASSQVTLYADAVAKKSQRTPAGLAARLKLAMTAKGMTQAQLIARIQQLAAGDKHEELRNRLSQQMVSFVLSGEAERSYYAPFFAEALDVPHLWLAFGIGRGPNGNTTPQSAEHGKLPAESMARIAKLRDAFDDVLREAGTRLSEEPAQQRSTKSRPP